MTQVQIRWAKCDPWGRLLPEQPERFKTVDGELVGEHLAVTPTPNPIEQPWAVTHVPTGFRIALAASADVARALAEQLATCGVDWTQCGTDAKQNRRVRGFRKAAALLRAHQEEQG